jgi:hypothetical protein
MILILGALLFISWPISFPMTASERLPLLVSIPITIFLIFLSIVFPGMYAVFGVMNVVYVAIHYISDGELW